MNRAVLPAEWRDRAGTLYTPVRRNSDGSVEYRLASAHQQSRAAPAGAEPRAAAHAEDVNLLANRLRAAGIGKELPKSPAGVHNLSPDRPAPSLEQLERFRRAVSSAAR